MGLAGMDLLQPGAILDPAAHRIVPGGRARLADAGARPLLRCDARLEPDTRLLRQTVDVVCGAELRRWRLSGRRAEPHPLRPARRTAQPAGKQAERDRFVNEGLDYNPIVFDFLFEKRGERSRWTSAPGCATMPGGSVAVTTRTARWPGPSSSRRPSPASTRSFQPATAPPSFKAAGPLPYSNERLAQAWELLLKAAPAVGSSDACRFDLVSVTRQVLANYSTELHAQVTDAWRAKDRKAFQAASSGMLGLIRDLDELLATRPEYLLGNWLEDARRWGANRAEKDRLEWDAGAS